MAVLSFENIKTQFFRITGESVSESFDDIISAAKNKLERAIAVSDPNADAIARCEYAAAAEAAYRACCEGASRSQPVMSELGAVRSGPLPESCLRAVSRLRDHAFAQLGGIISDSVFSFCTVEG